MEMLTDYETRAIQLTTQIIKDVVDAFWCFGIKSKMDRCVGDFSLQPLKCETVHLYLLVFGTEAESKTITETISKKSEKKVTATVLFYESRKLSKIKGNHRRFLHGVISRTDCLYRKKEYVIPEFANVKDDKKAKINYWNHNKYMVKCFLEAENAIENPNGEPVQAILLHQAVEHICIGLIYVFLGCRPNHFGLDYLLDLCALFLPEVDEIFPRSSEEEKLRFSVLSLRMESLRYRIPYPSITDIEVLRNRVNNLMGISVLAVNKVF